MKKRFLLLLCALLALPVFASAEDVLTLSGAALNAAQTIAADDSLIITETITDEEGTSVTVLSHRLNDLRQEVFTLLDEDGTLTQLRPDYGFRLASDSANPETLRMFWLKRANRFAASSRCLTTRKPISSSDSRMAR